MTPIDSSFDDPAHLERTVQRVLSFAGTQISSDEPVLEVGVTLANRACPPDRDCAAHQPDPARGCAGCIRRSQRLWKAASRRDCSTNPPPICCARFSQRGHGLMIVGDVGTGKTTLLQALIPLLPAKSIVVERAQELRLPPDIEHRAAIPPGPQTMPVTFAEAIDSAVDQNPSWLVLDEIRFDEAKAMWRALTPQIPRRAVLWHSVARLNPGRLRAAFSMSVRRAQAGH